MFGLCLCYIGLWKWFKYFNTELGKPFLYRPQFHACGATYMELRYFCNCRNWGVLHEPWEKKYIAVSIQVSVYILLHTVMYLRIVIPASCCNNNSSFYEWTSFKACLLGITLTQKKCYLPVYLHALMAAEEWEAGEKSETVSGLIIVSFTQRKKQHGEKKRWEGDVRTRFPCWMSRSHLLPGWQSPTILTQCV